MLQAMNRSTGKGNVLTIYTQGVYCKDIPFAGTPIQLLFLLVMLFHHLDHDRECDNEGRIYSLCDINSVAVAEKRELPPNLCEQVAIVVADTEIPTPDITVDVEDHTIAALDLEAFAEEAELFMHTGPVLPIAVDFVPWQQRENTLFDLCQWLSTIAVNDNEVVSDMKKFTLNL